MLAPTTITTTAVAAHNVFVFADGVTLSSNFDNGNLARVERCAARPFDFKIWTAPDNLGSAHQSKHCAWFFFTVTGAPLGCVLRMQIANASNHSGLYKHDMRPVYKSNGTNQKWCRIKSSVRFLKENDAAQLFFEHSVDADNDKISFAFTYPYTYTMVQNELELLDSQHCNDLNEPNSIFYQRELAARSCDGRRIDLITITSVDGADIVNREPLLRGLFPELTVTSCNLRPPTFPQKEVVFISSRVHPGEVPAQHTFKGIFALLMDKNDLTAQALRQRYVFKLIPMLNPDGVYRGHFRMDQHGQNLNRYYSQPDAILQPSIFVAKSLLDYYASTERLTVYLDFHAHASKRGCFIYGNVLESVDDQIQNQLYCKLISLNTPHFDYENCLFSREHMFRIDPGDQAKGLTAEGSGRVANYLAYGLIHSYTIECNYNTSRVGNEVAAPEVDPGGACVTPPSPFTTSPEKYTPTSYATVGRACVVALLDIRGHNPCSRIPKSKFKTLERVRNAVVTEVRSRKEYFGKPLGRERRKSASDRRSLTASPTAIDDSTWRRIVEVQHGCATGATSSYVHNTGSEGQPLRQIGSQQKLVEKPVEDAKLRSVSAGSTMNQAEIVRSDSQSISTRRRRSSLTEESTTAEVTLKLECTPPAKEAPPRYATSEKLGLEQRASKPRQRENPGADVLVLTRSQMDSYQRATTDAGLLIQQRSRNQPISEEQERASSETDSTSQSEKTGTSEALQGASTSPEHLRIMGPAMRDFLREQSIRKLIKLSQEMPVPLSSSSAKESSRKPSQGGGAVNHAGPIPPVHKDNRKILGKTLHAAGVALLMGASPSSPSLSPVDLNRTSSSCLFPSDSNKPKQPTVAFHRSAHETQEEMVPVPSIRELPDVAELMITGSSGTVKRRPPLPSRAIP